MNYDYAIVEIACATGWTLEYIRSLPIRELRLFWEELNYQSSVSEYREAQRTGTIVMTLINLNSNRKYSLEDIVGPPPQRRKVLEDKQDLWNKAERAGIKLPSNRD